ncbi:MAG: hypothetical protein OXG13_22325 [Gemmatimonadaceae bacterium]|nr:hypothetical protein [Gemmatimonadaceae bacterium]
MGKQDRRRDHRRKADPRPEAESAAPAPAAPALRRYISRPWFAPALFALVALVYFWEFPLSGKVVFGHDVGLDFHRGKAPVAEKLRDLVPPAWSPFMGGYPASEEIRHKFFPTYLIELFTTHQRAVGWRYILVVFAAGWGMFLYLRQVGVHRWAALWGGLAFLSAPTFLSFPYAGHYAKMSVIALFPFLLLCVERGMDGGRQALGSWAALAVLVAIGIFTPHLQMMQYALLGTGAYSIYKLVHLRLRGLTLPRLAERAGLFAAAAAVGLGLAAEGVYPPYLHVKTESKRAAVHDGTGRTPEEQLAHARSWSLHPEEIASLVVPEFGGFDDPTDQGNRYWGRNPMKLNSEYFGILVLLLALAAVPGARASPLVLFLGLLFAAAAAFTLGGHTPVHWIAYHLLPGGKELRTIGMAAFLFAFAAVALAALGLGRVLRPEGDAPILSRRILVAGAVLTGLCLVIALAPRPVTEAWTALLWADAPEFRRRAMTAAAPWLARGGLIGAGVCAAGTALLLLHLRHRVGAGLLVLGLCALTVADTWRIDRLFLKYEDPARHADYRQANPDVRAFLERQPGRFRLFPVPGHAFLKSARYHLDGADVATGFADFTLRRYDRLLKELEPVESVLRARHAEGREVRWTDGQILGAARPILDLMGARFLVTPRAVELRAEGFPEVFAGRELRLYANETALPRFRLAPHAEVLPGEAEVLTALREGRYDLRRTVLLEEPPPIDLPGPEADLSGDHVTEELYDYREGVVRLIVSAGGPRLLVIADNHHPHWSALVDGRPAPLLRADYVWKAVPVPGGDNVVELLYRSPPVARARAVGAASAVIVLAGAVMALRRHRFRSGVGG